MASLLALLTLCALPSSSQGKETLIWLLRDMPPVTIFSGPQQGQGAIDRLMPLLIARMPEYDHLLMHVNRARGMQMLLDRSSFTCDPMLLWTAERAKNLLFSIPTYAVRSNGLVVRHDDMASFTPFISDNQIDLAALLKSRTIKLGVVAERSYGSVIDRILRDTPANELNLHYGNDAIGSLLQMERLGRLQALISYWPEALYQARQQGIVEEELIFLPVKGTPKYQFTHVGCSDSPQGQQAMEIINREMRVLRKTSLIGLYAQWLPNGQREEYLQDAKAFFEDELR
ncbi:hypothetical protein IV02_27525 [Pseudomonas syringae]|jgi:uncharacterized protein (TIGR02285 family)|uniref:Uncharacterized protein n=1 Tax=Pseudomonas syringae TaxID=317 RepID=A0A085UP24_PSESX|nr:hypothetical protein IV02_27525 [Pseudomonas syringae]